MCATPIQIQDLLHRVCAGSQGSWGRRVKACDLTTNGADETERAVPLLSPAACYALVAGVAACLPRLERLVLNVVQAGWPASERPYTLHLRPLQGLLHLSDLQVVYRGSTAAEVQVGARHCVLTGWHHLRPSKCLQAGKHATACSIGYIGSLLRA